MKLGELFFELGFKDFGKENYENFNKQIKDISKNSKNMLINFNNVVAKTSPLKRSLGELVVGLRSAALGIMGVSSAMIFLEKKAGDSAISLDKLGLASLTGLSSSQLQRYDVGLKQIGGSLSDLTSAISTLQSKSIDVALGRGGDLGVYAFLGLNPHDDPLKQLDQLSYKLKTMPTALGTKMARDLGLSDNLIYLLKNKEQLFSVREGTLLSEKELRRLRDFSFYFTSVWEQAKRLFLKFAATVSPVVTKLLESFDRITFALSINIDKMAKFFGTLRQYSHWIFLAVTAIMAAFAPFTLALSMIYLILDDIATYFSGGDSLIGWIMEQDWFKTAKSGFLSFYHMMSDKIKELKPRLIALYNTVKEKIGNIIDYLKPKIIALYKILSQKIGDLIDYMKPKLIALYETLSEKSKEWFQIMREKFSDLYAYLSKELPILKNKIIELYKSITIKIGEWVTKIKDSLSGLNKKFFDVIIESVNILLDKLDLLMATFWRLVQFFTIGGFGKYDLFFTKKIRAAELGRPLTPEEIEDLKKEKSRELKDSPEGTELDNRFIDILKKGLNLIPDLDMSKSEKIEGSAKSSEMDNRLIDLIKKGWNAINLFPRTQSNQSKNVINKNNVTINISGAKSPEATAEVVKSKISQAFFQFGTKEAYS